MYPCLTATFGGKNHRSRWVYDSHNMPRKDNLEYEFSCLLGSKWLYEPWSYELPGGYRFRPDFWAPPGVLSAGGVHIEFTRYDQAIQQLEEKIAEVLAATATTSLREVHELRRELHARQQGYERKQMKVRQTERLYRVPVVLVTSASLERLKRRELQIHDLLALPAVAA